MSIPKLREWTNAFEDNASGKAAFDAATLADAQRNDTDIADPDDAGAIDVSKGGTCALTSLGVSETRTVAIPTYVGQVLTLIHEVDGGDIDVTVASAFNKAGNTAIAFAVLDDSITLIGVDRLGVLAWRVLATDGPVLS